MDVAQFLLARKDTELCYQLIWHGFDLMSLLHTQDLATALFNRLGSLFEACFLKLYLKKQGAKSYDYFLLF